MRYNDGTANNKSDAEDLKELFAGQPLFVACLYVIADAIIASQDQRRRQPEHLLDVATQCAIFVYIAVEIKKSFDDKVVLVEDLVVHFFAKRIEFIDGICHGRTPPRLKDAPIITRRYRTTAK